MPTNETPTLLPCPFCGTEAQMNRTWGYWHVMCRSDVCVVQRMSNGFDTETEAAAAWNTRHLDPATLALARLGAWLMEQTRGDHLGCDVDGGAVQDNAWGLGVLAPVEATEPCGEGCVCGDVGFPTFCYRYAPGIRERVAELLHNTEARERREDRDNA
jgi:hypothetical protein